MGVCNAPATAALMSAAVGRLRCSLAGAGLEFVVAGTGRVELEGEASGDVRCAGKGDVRCLLLRGSSCCLLRLAPSRGAAVGEGVTAVGRAGRSPRATVGEVVATVWGAAMLDLVGLPESRESVLLLGRGRPCSCCKAAAAAETEASEDCSRRAAAVGSDTRGCSDDSMAAAAASAEVAGDDSDDVGACESCCVRVGGGDEAVDAEGGSAAGCGVGVEGRGCDVGVPEPRGGGGGCM